MTRLKVWASQKGYTALKREKVTLIAESMKGKQTITKRIILPKFKSPAEFESKIIKLLD